MSREDDFSASTKRVIAQRSGYLCAFPNCMAPTSGPALEGSSSVNIGVAAHITAASTGGPRFDPTMSAEDRRSAKNGIWMCATHATLIDRDVERYTTELLREWRDTAEIHALKMLGQPKGCSRGKIATVSPAIRLGAEGCVIVENEPIPYAPIFNVDDPDERITWFVSGLVIQFSIKKDQNLQQAIVEHLVVTVHETKPVPEYRSLFGVYPAQVNLFYVEIESNKRNIPREFIPTRYYTHIANSNEESQEYPPPIVLDDNTPAQIALRFNAKENGMYLISTDAVISSGDERERVPVMPPQWIIFETPEPFPDLIDNSEDEAD